MMTAHPDGPTLNNITIADRDRMIAALEEYAVRSDERRIYVVRGANEARASGRYADALELDQRADALDGRKAHAEALADIVRKVRP